MESKLKSDPNGSFKVYAEYNSALRNWLIGYGIGLPAVILSNQNIFQIIDHKSEFKVLMSFLIVGVLSQIISAIINKITNWLVYRVAEDISKKDIFIYKHGVKLSERFYIDIFLDLVSIFTYMGATCFAFKLMA